MNDLERKKAEIPEFQSLAFFFVWDIEELTFLITRYPPHLVSVFIRIETIRGRVIKLWGSTK